MALSTVTYITDGTNDSFSIPFKYLKKSHMFVKVNGINKGFSFTSDYMVKLDVVPAIADTVRVYRETPKDVREVVFKNPSIQDASDFNLNSDQLFFIMQESFSDLENNEERMLELLEEYTYNLRLRVEETEDALALLDDGGSDNSEVLALAQSNALELEALTLSLSTLNTTLTESIDTEVETLRTELTVLINSIDSGSASSSEGVVGSVVYARSNPNILKYVAAQGNTLSRLAYPDLFQSLGDDYRVVTGVSPQITGVEGINNPTYFDATNIGRFANGNIVMSDNSYTYFSVDGGLSWTDALNTDGGASVDVEGSVPFVIKGSVGLTKGRAGFAGNTAKDDHILFTLDSGLTWNEVTLPNYIADPGSTVNDTVEGIFIYESGFLIMGGNDEMMYTEDLQTFTQIVAANKKLTIDGYLSNGFKVGDFFIVGYNQSIQRLPNFLKFNDALNVYTNVPVLNDDINKIMAELDYSPYTGKLHGVETSSNTPGLCDYEVIVGSPYEISKEFMSFNPSLSGGNVNQVKWLSGKAWIAIINHEIILYPDGLTQPGAVLETVHRDIDRIHCDGVELVVSGDNSNAAKAIDRFIIEYDADLFRVPTLAGDKGFNAYIKKTI